MEGALGGRDAHQAPAKVMDTAAAAELHFHHGK